MNTSVKGIVVITLLLTGISLAHNAGAKAMDGYIYLVPVGDIDKKVVQAIKEAIPNSLPATLKIEITPQENIPDSAYDPARKQYSAEIILNDISNKMRLDTRVENALAIVDADLYSKDKDFVFGASDAPKMTSVISLARLRNEFYGLKPDNKLFLKRVIKEALHELGHTWKLPHCSDQRCVMNSSDNLSAMDKKKSSFCLECQKTLRGRYGGPLFRGSLPVLK